MYLVKRKSHIYNPTDLFIYEKIFVFKAYFNEMVVFFSTSALSSVTSNNIRASGEQSEKTSLG